MVKVFEPEYLREPNAKDMESYWQLEHQEVFQICWVQLTACIAIKELHDRFAREIPRLHKEVTIIHEAVASKEL